MKIAVRFYSKGGNTRKIANAIAEAVGEEALTTDVKLGEDVDILFLGSSVYAAGIDKSVKEFIKGIDVKVGKVVNFSTAAILKSTYNQVSKLLAEKGIAVDEREFACRGSFMMMHKGKPDAADCKAAAEFAKKIIT